MEPDRFDDVELHVMEQPEPRGPGRATRWGLAIVAGILSAGALAAGAWALTDSSDATVRPVAKQRIHQPASDASWHGVRPCGERHRTVSATAPRD